MAEHQTGRNSGVLHSRIYYKPGSLKAINCRAGKQAMEAFSQAEGIAFELCGKVIVAVTKAERPGLHSDRVAKLAGVKPGCQVVPFRGEYFELTPEARKLSKNLIYPRSDPLFPFLGVHFTRMIEGTVECGPTVIAQFSPSH
ncbi:hypothetical protein BH11PLA2_BH11PLA2_49420 [soil metagenome]